MTVASPLPFTDSEIQVLKNRYENAGQGHVFKFFDSISQDEKVELLKQLVEIDVDNLNTIYKKAIEGAEMATKGVDELKPLSPDVFDSVLKHNDEQLKEWEMLGLQQIAHGKVAVILMAGGQGTRLGSSDPKGCYNINLPSGKSLFQLQAERILKAQELAHQHRNEQDPQETIIPWYIMTSGPTNQPTYDFFKKNNFFGLKEENVIFFEQGTLPCLTMDGKIILETKSKVAIAPDGNGGIYKALQEKGIIRSLRERGIEYSHCYCVDNCLARVADPVFIGYCVSKGTDCGVKVVGKMAPEEPVGIVCVRNGKYAVVEYSEITQETANERYPDGSLKYGAANIANHFFSTSFLERVPSFQSELEYHIAKKKIKYTNLETGEQIVPKTNSGMKLECFVFDVFPYAHNMSVLEVKRQDEFSPLKNAPGSGADCPETSRRDIVAQHVRFIENAGGKVVGDTDDYEQLVFEISPAVSYAGEGLKQIVSGKIVKAPATIETLDDLIRATC
ncbi:nucleotide-diphospho-sugar transferase [Cokeromyces recurvatus]|uniref:nucleotide-diphospho-sugar transferase n=1 Tax=Cokeromyces recurvatus TaxID=90255 RepID=UPI0022211DF4|nr:nucleotide-diphospho-sugar transferase [Cokeromyces recurvatus]KAI7903870.1 nucleotide-diphospho-sugar transferase [Cokeromyces recurvatus]